jgi:hypothetical protein
MYEVVDQLSTMKHTLRELDVDLTLECVTDRMVHPQHIVDFSTWTSLTVLRLPYYAWIESVSYMVSEVPGNGDYRWDLPPIPSFHTRLPPQLQELSLWFQSPNGVFAIGSLHMASFLASPDRCPTRGYAWILALLERESLRKVQLGEESDWHNPMVQYTRKRNRSATVAFVPPEAVTDAFEAAGVQLEIRVLDLIMLNVPQ